METKRKRLARYLQDALILLVLGGVFYLGASWQIFATDSDPSRYQCYAVAFWQGWTGFQKLPPEQCTFLVHPDKHLIVISQDSLLHTMQQWGMPSGLIHFVAAQSPDQPYHTLPYEYPWLILLPFSLALLAPTYWYQAAFAIEMLLLIGWIYLVLLRWQSRQAALAYSLYLVVGAWAIVAARFDLIPAALTLFAVICAVHKRWNWAFAILGLATLSKFYPVTLLVPFLLALQQETQAKWYAWRKWLPMGIFVAICTLGIAVSLLLSVVGTLAPMGYFGNRPVEVESLAASILWVCSLLGRTSLRYTFTFGSLNVLSPLSWSVTLLLTVLLGVGLLYTWWLQWRGRMDLAMACLVTLLIVIITGKVFSAQYLIWVIPLAAYVGQTNRSRWMLFWALLGILTSGIYPIIYYKVSNMFLVPYIPQFYPTTAVRNCLLLGFIVSMLISRSCPCYKRYLKIRTPTANCPQKTLANP